MRYIAVENAVYLISDNEFFDLMDSFERKENDPDDYIAFYERLSCIVEKEPKIYLEANFTL